MSGPVVKLGDICRFEYGKNLPTPERIAGDYQVFGSNGSVGTHTSGYTNGKTVIIGRKGSIGEAVYSDRSCWPIDTTYYVDQSGTGQDLRWIYYLITSLNLRRFNKATGVPSLNRTDAYECLVPLPPLDEQKRIAAILDQADELRRLRARAIEKLNTLGQAIFHEMFGSDSSQWDQINLTEFVKDVSDIKCGPFGTQLLKDEFTSHGIPLWGIKQVNQHFTLPTYEFISDEKFKSLAMYSIEPDDIIMTRKGTVGNCAVYPKHFPKGVMHSDLLRIRVDSDRHNAIFLADQFKYSGDFMRQLALISGGAVMPGINVGKLKALKAIAPPKQAQDAYASRICVLNQQHLRTLLFSKKSEALFASLQSAAFQGKL